MRDSISKRFAIIMVILLALHLTVANNIMQSVSAKSVTLKMSLEKKTIYKGNSFKLKVRIKGKKKNIKILWKSSKKSVASVSKKGVVKAKKVGKANIYAIVKGKNIKARCRVTVKSKTSKTPQNTRMPGDGSTTVPKVSSAPAVSTATPVTVVTPTPDVTSSPEVSESPVVLPELLCDTILTKITDSYGNETDATAFVLNKSYNGTLNVQLAGRVFSYSLDAAQGENVGKLLVSIKSGRRIDADGQPAQEFHSDNNIWLYRGNIIKDGVEMMDPYWTFKVRHDENAESDPGGKDWINDESQYDEFRLKAATAYNIDDKWPFSDCGVIYIQGDVRDKVNLFGDEK